VYRSGDLCPTPINVILAVVMSQNPCRVLDGGQLSVLTETGTVQSLTFGYKIFMLLNFNFELFNINYSIKRGWSKQTCFG